MVTREDVGGVPLKKTDSETESEKFDHVDSLELKPICKIIV